MLQEKNFVETKLATKFATFNLRVYPDDAGKETLVLWTDDLDISQPVLTRVHSECITGDTLGSLHCDCGQQFHKSLHLISEEGGVLIYLRQEGRGIGLVEKMKTYQLQAKGYDTFEANVLLGHRPDARSYEMVKTALDDLGITRVRLLTNNPSKISEISKLGILVTERIPLICESNKHNKKYLETKRRKFQHFLDQSTHHYFYQFHADTAEQADQILTFVSQMQKDPLLRICVGITANHSSLKNKKEIQRINSVVEACKKHPNTLSILHFSFSDSSDVWADIQIIKRAFPYIDHLQLNDTPNLNVPDLQRMGDLFSLHIPLSNDNFHIIYDVSFQKFVKRNKSTILLDNSKGKGIKESKENFMKRIDELLAFGLNDIALCGGFGPDELDSYFEIRRYYRFNFSIDAETKLKTRGKVDVKKTKAFLLQLLGYEDHSQDRKEMVGCVV